MDTAFDSLTTYINLAKKTISKFAPKHYNGLAAEMLSSDDAIADVANAIMQADWKFDPNRTGKTGDKKTRYSYRNQCAIWAIKSYISNKYKKKKPSMSLNFENDSNSEVSSNIADTTMTTPEKLLINLESRQNLTEDLETLLDSHLLNEKQKDQIKLYYLEGLTLSEIGKRYNVSREAVRQNIKRAIKNIRDYDSSYC